jgi:hypothetical protein
MIVKKSTKEATKLCVCNYEHYQDTQQREQQAGNRPATTENKGNKENNKNPSISPQESLEYLPEHFRGGKFETTWIKWWEYRKSEHWTTKISYAKSSCRDLEKLAHGNVSIARKVVEQSMAKGWQGLFSLKDGSTGSTGASNRYMPKKELKFGKKSKNLQDE